MLDHDFDSIPIDQRLYRMVVERFEGKLWLLNGKPYLPLINNYMEAKDISANLLISVENFVRMFGPALSAHGWKIEKLEKYSQQQTYGEEITRGISQWDSR